MGVDTFHTRKEIRVGTKAVIIHSLRSVEKALGIQTSRLPYSIRILLENLLRREDNRIVKKEDIENLARWNAKTASDREIAFMPARVLLQDFTGVPCVVDLASMRDAMVKMGEDPGRINPLLPVDLVIDHSVQVDEYGNSNAFQINSMLEFDRNKERYSFLRWGQRAFKNFRVVPPDTGIVHQVNLEYLSRVVFTAEENGLTIAFPDTLVGTDSHTTMVNGLGILGWGVGGIEAEAAMLGQPVSMLIPQVVGFKLTGQLKPGTTATDIVLTITQALRRKGVVGKFVEFTGPGLAFLSLADRATIANMSPEYGATVAFFPADAKTIEYLRLTGREEEHIALVETYLKEQNLFHTADAPEPEFSSIIELNLASVEPCIAGPRRPQERIPVSKAKTAFRSSLLDIMENSGTTIDRAALAQWVYYMDDKAKPEFFKDIAVNLGGVQHIIRHGSVVIAAITSCTNTSNPSVLIAAGLLAKKAVEKGLKSKPWVKTSLAPGSKIVTEYLKEAGLMEHLEALGFFLVGYGCTTCIGNSGPLPETIANAVRENSLIVASVLSGNRNFEGRINPLTRANFLASPPLVITYALTGTMDIDFLKDPIGTGTNGEPVFLKDIWPSPQEIEQTMKKAIRPDMFKTGYADVFEGENNWQNLEVPAGAQYEWNERSTYIKAAPFFNNMPAEPKPLQDIHKARVLAMFGDSITTDHISPAGTIDERTPAGRYLLSLGIAGKDFNQYGARRGNHEIMMRGTFANPRLVNLLMPGKEGGFTALHPSSEESMPVYNAAVKYKEEGIPLILIAGKEYGCGSSRDWAAKGPALLGVQAVIAESFERIHRSNLIGMGILPLQFEEGQNAKTLDLSGFEIFDIEGIASDLKPKKKVTVTATMPDGAKKNFAVICRIDTPNEADYYRHGGILQFVLRSLANKQPAAPEIQLPPKIEGSKQRYKIVFRGEIDPAYDIQAVKGDLAIFFKTTTAQIEKLFTGKPVTLNTNLDHITASDYITGMRSIGALCYFEPIQTIQIPAPVQATVQSSVPVPPPPRPQEQRVAKIQPRPMPPRPVQAPSSRSISSKSKPNTRTPEKTPKASEVSIFRGIITAGLTGLIFILYPILILFLAGKLFEHIVDNITMIDEYSLPVGGSIYIFIILAGILLLISMVKPFFARPLSKQLFVPVFRKKEQALTGYIDKIAQALGSVLRVNIELNCSAGVALQYKRGLIGFLEGSPSLTIGVPVLAEMTVGEFTSLVAAELGHFTQKIRLQLFFIITTINSWFSRVVLEEDETDRKLMISSQTGGTGIGLLVPVMKMFIWLARKVLALFMLTVRKVTSSYMQQVEFDGDRAAVRIAGFESLESAFGKMCVLAEGSKKALQQLRMPKQPTDTSLPNNFIQLISLLTQKMSDDEINRLRASGLRGKPENRLRQLTFRERLDAARHVAAKPAFQSDQPASSLVTNINELASTATMQMYRDTLGLQVEPSSLVSPEDFLSSLEMYSTSKSPEITPPSSNSEEPPDISGVIDDGNSNPFF
jgi:aconitate hydratase